LAPADIRVLREDLGLTGTKFGCGVGACGACTVHVNGEPTRSCSLPLSAAVGAEVVTIEGAEKAFANRFLAEGWCCGIGGCRHFWTAPPTSPLPRRRGYSISR
jgi:isoquinoline 1-oxidoreductase alpha subunit